MQTELRDSQTGYTEADKHCSSKTSTYEKEFEYYIFQFHKKLWSANQAPIHCQCKSQQRGKGDNNSLPKMQTDALPDSPTRARISPIEDLTAKGPRRESSTSEPRQKKEENS